MTLIAHIATWHRANPSSPCSLPQAGPPQPDRHKLRYCERFLEFMTDLLSQLPTRRFVHALLEERAVLVKARLSPLYQHDGAALFRQLLDLLQFYMFFPINDHTGVPRCFRRFFCAGFGLVCHSASNSSSKVLCRCV